MIKRITAFVLSALLAVGFFGCKDGKNRVTTDDYLLWSAPSTVKIMQNDTAYSQKGELRLDFEGVRGEAESAQLLITATGADINDFNLTASAVNDDAGNTIPATAFTVYNEWYVEVSISSTTARKAGVYPDALVPIDLAREAGETKVKKGNNGALWITVDIPRDIPAGKYSGSFALDVAGNAHTVPVTVNVRDFTLSETPAMTTLFVTRENTMAQSEKDSTVEMKRAYYEFFLDYGISLSNLPIDSMDPNDYVETAKKYVADPRVTNYVMPWSTVGYFFTNFPAWHDIFLALIANSSSELNLITKLSFYFVDEPEASNSIDRAVSELRAFHSFLNDIVTEIKADKNGTYDSFTAMSDWEEQIQNVRNVVTLWPGTDEHHRLSSVWCPQWGEYQTQSEIEDNFAAIEEVKPREVWWYGCIGPKYPWPTYHIDDNLLSSRAVSWLAQCYAITGTLFWGVESGGNVYESPHYIDGFESPIDLADPAGDGFLVYPGSKYGHYGPLPSLRLMSIRDGFEDYALLKALEDRYTELSDNYGTDMDVRNIVAQLYAQIHNTTMITEDIGLFGETRKLLLDTVDEVYEPHGFILANSEIFESTATLTMYVDSEHYGLAVDGTVLMPSLGDKFVYELDLNEKSTLAVKITSKSDPSESYTISRYISGRVSMINNFDNASVLDLFELSEGSSVAMDMSHSIAGSSVMLNVTSKITGDPYNDSVFLPYADLSSNAFASSVNFEDVVNLKFNLFNLGSEDVTVRVRLKSGTSSISLGTLKLAGGGTMQASLAVDTLNWNRKNAVDGIRFEFENAGTVGEPKAYTVSVDNMFVELKAR